MNNDLPPPDINAPDVVATRSIYGHEVVNLLMHGVETGVPVLPCYCSEKLNGVRCVYVPGQGFYSRTARRWKKEVLAHITPPTTNFLIDGELYAPDMSLQEINSAVAVTRDNPGPSAERVKFYAFDLVVPYVQTFYRNRDLKFLLAGRESSNMIYHKHLSFADRHEFENYLESVRLAGGEGVMCKSTGFYVAGRSGNLIKVKLWKNLELVVVGFIEGEGKCRGMVGAVQFLYGTQFFEVGTMQIDYTERERLWCHRADYIGLSTARLRYLTLSDDGIPLNASVETIEPL